MSKPKNDESNNQTWRNGGSFCRPAGSNTEVLALNLELEDFTLTLDVFTAISARF